MHKILSEHMLFLVCFVEIFTISVSMPVLFDIIFTFLCNFTHREEFTSTLVAAATEQVVVVVAAAAAAEHVLAVAAAAG